MGFFKPLPPGVAEKMLEGHEDTLTPMVQVELDFVNKQLCPRCGSNVIPEHDIRRLIKGVNRPLARCGECKCLFDPYSGLLLEMGNLANLEPAIPIINPSED